MDLIVQKYGGSSLASPQKIKNIAKRISTLKKNKVSLIVVVSAMGRMTDALLRLAFKVSKTPPQRELDMLMTAGERVSMSLLAMALEEEGVEAISFTGSQSGIITSNHHNEGRILEIRGQRITEELNKQKVVIIAGFQGVSLQKEITTLGRGGSDTTAVALAAHFKARHCEILTDVDGLFTVDPRLVPQAKLITHLEHDMAVTLSALGAKMHPRSVTLAKKFKMPLWISSAHNLNSTGTWIVSERKIMESNEIIGLISKKDLALAEITCDPLDFTAEFNKHQIPLYLMESFANKVRFVCDEEKAYLIENISRERKWELQMQTKLAMVSLAGNQLNNNFSALFQLHEILRALHISPLWIQTHPQAICIVILRQNLEELVRKGHEAFLSQ